MYKYKFQSNNTGYNEFESEHYLLHMEVLNFNGTSMIFFEDAQIGINLKELREIEIDGQSYEVSAHSV